MLNASTKTLFRVFKLAAAAGLCVFAAVCAALFVFVAPKLDPWKVIEGAALIGVGTALMVGGVAWFCAEYRGSRGSTESQ